MKNTRECKNCKTTWKYNSQPMCTNGEVRTEHPEITKINGQNISRPLPLEKSYCSELNPNDDCNYHEERKHWYFAFLR